MMMRKLDVLQSLQIRTALFLEVQLFVSVTRMPPWVKYRTPRVTGVNAWKASNDTLCYGNDFQFASYSHSTRPATLSQRRRNSSCDGRCSRPDASQDICNTRLIGVTLEFLAGTKVQEPDMLILRGIAVVTAGVPFSALCSVHDRAFRLLHQ